MKSGAHNNTCTNSWSWVGNQIPYYWKNGRCTFPLGCRRNLQALYWTIKFTPISSAVPYSFLQRHFLKFMPICSLHTYWKFDYQNLKLRLWLLGEELVVADGGQWILRGDFFGSPQRMVPENGTWWQIGIDVAHYTILIFPHAYIDFKDANCAPILKRFYYQ